MRFDSFSVASPVCVQSRASFLTGLYFHQDGIVKGPSQPKLADNTPTIATHLNQAGYLTGFVGKAHLGGDPRKWKFKETPFYYLGGNFGKGNSDWRRTFFENGERELYDGDPTRRFADHAISFLEKNRTGRWFLWLATTAPHIPIFYHEDHPYDDDEIVSPPGWPKEEEFKNRILAPERPDVRNTWGGYYSLISHLDEQLGRVLKQLDDLGLRDNTVVIFASDNGIQYGSHDVQWKGMWYEGSTRQPLIVRWPGRVKPGSTNTDPVSNVDFMPTVLEIAGKEAPAGLEAKSFLPVLDGKTGKRKYIYSEGQRAKSMGGGNWEMIKDERYKFVNLVELDEEYLYDLKNDPGEQTNLMESDGHKETADRLRDLLITWRQSTK